MIGIGQGGNHDFSTGKITGDGNYKSGLAIDYRSSPHGQVIKKFDTVETTDSIRRRVARMSNIRRSTMESFCIKILNILRIDLCIMNFVVFTNVFTATIVSY